MPSVTDCFRKCIPGTNLHPWISNRFFCSKLLQIPLKMIGKPKESTRSPVKSRQRFADVRSPRRSKRQQKLMMGIWKLEYKTLHLGHLGDEFPYPQCILRMIFPIFPVKQPCNHLHDSPFPTWLLVLWEQPPHSRFVSRSWVGEKYPRQCEKLLHLQHKNWHVHFHTPPKFDIFNGKS